TRTDIFSFGAVLYEMLTGRHAFEGDSAVSTLSAILRDEIKPMTEVVPDVPPQLDSVIQRCMRKNPDERWQTMLEIRTALSALKRESDSGALYASRISPYDIATPPERPSSVQKTTNSKVMAAAVLAILLIAVIVGVWAWSKRKPAVVSQPAPDPVAPQAAAAKPPDETLTNDVVLTMIQEKIPVDLIIDQIHSAKSTAFDL